MDLDLAALRRRGEPAEGRRFTVLFVCTGNICRSALAEAALRERLADAVLAERLAVASAGTDVVRGIRMPVPIAHAIRELGGDPETHRITAVTRSALEEAGLVLVATRAHRTRVATIAPTIAPRLFTLLEFARLASAPGMTAVASSTLHEVVSSIGRRRGLVASAREESDDDIRDPFRQSDAVYRAVIGDLLGGVSVVAETLSLGLPGAERFVAMGGGHDVVDRA